MEEAKPRNESSSSLAKTAVKSFCEGSTIHGISPIFRAKNVFMRLFWIAMLVSVWSLLAWQVSKMIRKIYSYDVIITTHNVNRDEMDFPVVMIANADPYSQARLSTFIKSVLNSTQGEVSLKTILSNAPYNQLKKLGNNPYLFGLYPLKACTFGGTDCWHDMYVETFPFVGNYLQFNPKNVVKQRMPGPEHGLSIILNINKQDYSNLFEHGYGVLVHIANIHFLDLSILRNKAIAASPGTATQIKMKKKETKRLSNPFPDNCTKATEAWNAHGLHLKRIVKYSPEMCIFGFLLRTQMKSCGFVDPQYKSMLAYYLDIEKSNLSFTIPNNYSAGWKCIKQTEFDNKQSSCPSLCLDEEYDFTISSLRWPTEKKAVELLAKIKKAFPVTSNIHNWTVQDIYKNLVKIEVYFEDFKVEVVEQKPAYNWDEFLSDFGGQVGLCIGASVYSAFEIGSLLLSLCYCLLCKFHYVKRHPVAQEE